MKVLRVALQFIFCAVIFAGLVSCASSKNMGQNFSPVRVTNFKTFEILPPENCAAKIDSLQRFTAKFKGNEISMPVLVQADSQKICMVLMNDFFAEMGSLFYDGMSLNFSSPAIPRKFKPEYIVADFQFAHYDFDVLRAELEKSGLDFISEGKCRKILDAGKIIEQIETDGNSISVKNFLRGYEFSLQEIQVEIQNEN